MNVEFRHLTVNSLHHCAKLQSNFGQEVEFLKTADVQSTLRALERKGWRPFANVFSDAETTEFLLIRSKQ